MNLIYKKQLRDALHKKKLYITLFIITLLGMIFYAGFTSVRNNLKYSINQYYLEQNLCDYTIKSSTYFNSDEANNFAKEFSLIDLYHHSVVVNEGDIYYKNDISVNIPLIIEGEYFNDQPNYILDYDYALKHHYHVGDTFFIENDRYTITALAKFVDYIFKGNYMPVSNESYVFLISNTSFNNYNEISFKSSLSLKEIKGIANNYFSNDFVVIKTSDQYSYTRVNNDLDLINSILFIFPIACFISIIIILYINYNRLIQDQKKYLGILKANGFKVRHLFFSLTIIPLTIVLLASLCGSLIGIKVIPLVYVNLLKSYYCLPPLRTASLFYSVGLPILILFFTSFITICVPLLLTVFKTPMELMKNEDSNNKTRMIFKNTNLPYHLKLVARNILTYTKKNICMILSSTIILGIVLAIFFVEDSINYTDETLAKKSFNADYYLAINNYYYDDAKTILEQDDSPISDFYYINSINIKTEYENIREDLYLYDETKPSLKVDDINNNPLDLTKRGIYLPSSYQKYGLNINDEITIYFSVDNYVRPFKFPVAGFIKEFGLTKFAMSLQTIEDLNKQIADYLKEIPTPFFVKLKDSYTNNDLAEFVEDNFKYYPLITSLNNNLNYQYKTETKITNSDTISDVTTFANLETYIPYNSNKLDLYLFDYKTTTLVLNDQNNQPITFKNDGLYINEKTAYNLQLHIGDTVIINYLDTIIPLTLSGITNSFIDSYCDFNYFNLMYKFSGGKETIKKEYLFNSTLTMTELKEQGLKDFSYFRFNYLNDLYCFNNSGIKIDDFESLIDGNTIYSRYQTYQSIINNNDKDSKLSLTVLEDGMITNINDNGIYLPIQYDKNYDINDSINIRLNNKNYTMKIEGFIKATSFGAFASSTYLKTISNDFTFNKDYSSYLIKTNNISQLKDNIFTNQEYHHFSINNLSSFKRNMKLIYDIITLTKVITTVLAGSIFILLSYNIGVICLNARLNDIKCFKAMGYKESKLNHMLTLENVIIVIIGAILAVPIGRVMCDYILKQVFIITMVRMFISTSFLTILTVIIIAITLILIASNFINRKVSRLDLLTLLKEK
ncbi:MAG: FtsX-like permease family protein [Bacilli bacterium]|nr:FtsX-like permease family protein [Bacilli bacterium]